MNFEDDFEDDGELIHYLTHQGCTAREIERVIAELKDYDKRMIRESVFDSIERGSFSLHDIIAAAKNPAVPT